MDHLQPRSIGKCFHNLLHCNNRLHISLLPPNWPIGVCEPSQFQRKQSNGEGKTLMPLSPCLFCLFLMPVSSAGSAKGLGSCVRALLPVPLTHSSDKWRHSYTPTQQHVQPCFCHPAFKRGSNSYGARYCPIFFVMEMWASLPADVRPTYAGSRLWPSVSSRRSK